MHVKKGDKVTVITGKDKGKTGTILKALPSEERVIVEGVNVVKKHIKKTRQGAGKLVSKELSIHVSNVKLTEKKAKAEDRKTHV